MEFSWVPGSNVAAISRGRGKSLSLDAFQILGNILRKLHDGTPGSRAEIANLLGIPPRQRGFDPPALVAALTCLNVKTVRGLYTSLQAVGWSGAACVARSYGAHAFTEASSSADPGALVSLASRPLATSQERPLPLVLVQPEDLIDFADSEESDSLDFTKEAAAAETERWKTMLEKWQQHKHYAPSIRMAQLSTFWITSGLPHTKFPSFIAWANARRSDEEGLAFGNINHSHHFLQEFAASIADALRYCTCAGLHARLPATGLPSDLTRVIDIVTIGGVGLLVIVYIQTDTEGNLIWNVVDCCPVEKYLKARQVAIGTKRGNFQFHSAEQLVTLVHRSEAAFKITKFDRALRMARTVADGAIAGPNSIKFVRRECIVDEIDYDPLKEGMCFFHAADSVFAGNDRKFPEARHHDSFLRLVRSSFAFGTGRLILRGIATEFTRIAAEARAKSDDFENAAAKAEVEGRARVAKRNRSLAAQKRAEALAIRKAGWDTWRRPLAPQEDGTRKVVWQSAARSRIFQIYGLVYWGLRVRMYESRENACLAAQSRGQTFTDKTGMNTRNMRAWRALGRTLLDINLLVFNCGRSDFRTKHVVAFTLMAQSSLKVGASASRKAALGASMGMLQGIEALVAMLGIVRLMEQLLKAPEWVLVPQACDGPGNQDQQWRPVALKNYTLWTTFRTLLAHNCWRQFPTLTARLPEILLGAHFCGVPLHTQQFDEPSALAEKRRPLAAGEWESLRQLDWAGQKKQMVLERRDKRFAATLTALGKVLDWARAERRSMMQKFFGWAPGSTLIFQEAEGLPRVNQDLETASESIDAPILQRDAGDSETLAVGSTNTAGTDHRAASATPTAQPPAPAAQPPAPAAQPPAPAVTEEEVEEEEGIRCAFAPPHKRWRKDDWVEDHYKDNAKAAVELADECARLWVPPPCATDNATEAMILKTCLATDDGDIDPLAEADQVSDSDAEVESTPAFGGKDPEANGSESNSAEASKKDDDDEEDEPAIPWVVKKLKTGRMQYMPLATYGARLNTEILKHSDAVSVFELHMDQAFGASLLESPYGATLQEEKAVSAVYDKFNGKLWGLALGSIPTDIIKDPPKEVFLQCTRVSFLEQYRHFREWVYGFRRLPYAGEFFTVCSYKVQQADGQGRAHGLPWIASAVDIREAGHWQHFIPRPGTRAHSRQYGRCVIVEVVTKPIMTKVYKYVLSTALAEVRSLGLWNIVVAFHRCVHIGRPSESLAETVGGVLNNLEAKWSSSHPMGTHFIVNAAMARIAGLRGVGGEEGVLTTALNMHFRCNGPEGWHFVQRGRPLATGTAEKKAELKNVVRRSNLPPWVDSLVRDLWGKRELQFVKPLPSKLKMALQFHTNDEDDEVDMSAIGDKTAASRRDLVAVGKRAYEPKLLHGDVFRKLNITALSLPAHLRPGDRAR